MPIHQYFQIDNCPEVRLSLWYRIYSIQDEVQKEYKYIRFIFAWQKSGDVIYYEIPGGSDVIVGAELRP